MLLPAFIRRTVFIAAARPCRTLVSMSSSSSPVNNPLLDISHTPTRNSRIALFAAGGDVPVPVICTGTWAWGDTSLWDYKPEDLDKIKKAFKVALNAQGGFFDTAEIYGNGESERIIRACIDSLSIEDRQRIVLATKWFPLPSPRNPFLFKPGLVSGLKKSLERLGVESVDLYQIHGPIGYHSWSSQARELAECVKLGLCKAVGVSNFNLDQLVKMHSLLASHGVPLASNQIEVNLLRQSPFKNGLIDKMKELGIVGLAYSPLAQGRLTGKYSSENPPPSGRRFSNIPMTEIDPLVAEMRLIAADRGVSVSAIAINWVLSKGLVPLGGAKNAEQAEQNAQALGFRLTDAEVARLEALGQDGKTSFWQNG